MQAAKLWYDWAISAEAQALGPKYAAYQAPPSMVLSSPTRN